MPRRAARANPLAIADHLRIVAVDRRHGGAAPAGVLDFSASINPLGPPPAALAVYHSAAEAISAYPPVYAERLEARIAQWFSIGADEIIVGNGSTQLIHLFARTYRLRLPFIAIPTFSEFANAIAVNECTPYALELRRDEGFTARPADVRRALKQGAEAVFMGRPNSPTGSMIPLAEAAEMVGECARQGALCIFDEAFIDFTEDGGSVLHLIQTLPHRRRSELVVIGSLTKIFAIPGLRVGFLAAAPAIIRELRERIEPWSLNLVAERVALACLEVADEFVRQTRRWLTPERAWLQQHLASIGGITVFPSAANFLMLMVDESKRREGFAEFMLSKGIMVRDLRGLPGCGPGFHRVAVRLRSDNQQLLAAARAYFGERP